MNAGVTKFLFKKNTSIEKLEDKVEYTFQIIKQKAKEMESRKEEIKKTGIASQLWSYNE